MSNAFTTERNANLPTGITSVDIQAGHVIRACIYDPPDSGWTITYSTVPT